MKDNNYKCNFILILKNMSKFNVEEIINTQFWVLWKEEKLTIEQKFFLELENILWKENVIIKNWEIEIKEESMKLIKALHWWNFIENLLIKVQSS